ncbi:MAG: hypothetical protein JNG86_13165 [Verrucomicrobiaceae bacterium]|nr:hypothetical protein [Verrucomicrobiaceae bacterium]
MKSVLPAFVFLFSIVASAQTPGELREWSRAGSAKFQAAFRGIEADKLILQSADGRSAAFPLASFSADDRAYVRARIAGLVLEAMTPPGVGKKDGAGWSGPVSASAADCAVEPFAASAQTQNRAGFRSRHFTVFCSTELPPEAMRDVAESCEAIHELFRVAPWGVLATPEDGERHVIELFATSADFVKAGGKEGTSGDYDDDRHTLRMTYGAAGLDQIGGVWTRTELPGIAAGFKKWVSILLMHDVLTLTPPWLISGMSDVIAQIPVVGGSAWPADMPKLPGGGAPLEKGAIEAMLTTPDPESAPKKPDNAHAALAAWYFMRLADGNRAQQITKLLKEAKADRVKWDDYERARVKFKFDWEAFLKQPGVKELPDGRIEFPGGLTPPEPPKTPRAVEKSFQMPWLLISMLLDGKTAGSLADEIVAKLHSEGF